MSSHVTVALHLPEETVYCDLGQALVPVPTGLKESPIAEYFASTGGLVRKIIDTQHSNDSEILGLLVLGVISSAEFYFRRILSEVARVCPLCVTQTEPITIPSGSVAFYGDSDFSSVIAAFEHESLADSKKISGEIRRFAGFQCGDGSSMKKALEDFELLCELRHCFVHSRGFVGLKAMRALGEKRRGPHKILVKQQQALDFIKLAHNAVRAVNHFLSNEVLNRWIDRDVLSGNWKSDKQLFESFWRIFAKPGEDSYSASPRKAYSVVRPILLKRRNAAAKQ